MASVLLPKVGQWLPAVRVLVVLLLAQPAVAAVVSSAAVRWPAVAVLAAMVEAIIAGLPVRVTSELADVPKSPGSVPPA